VIPSRAARRPCRQGRSTPADSPFRTRPWRPRSRRLAAWAGATPIC